jgi:hypothetical protein
MRAAFVRVCPPTPSGGKNRQKRRLELAVTTLANAARPSNRQCENLMDHKVEPRLKSASRAIKIPISGGTARVKVLGQTIRKAKPIKFVRNFVDGGNRRLKMRPGRDLAS